MEQEETLLDLQRKLALTHSWIATVKVGNTCSCKCKCLSAVWTEVTAKSRRKIKRLCFFEDLKFSVSGQINHGTGGNYFGSAEEVGFDS
jgi:hypothetical protein